MQLGIQVKKVNTYIKGQPSFEIDFKQEFRVLSLYADYRTSKTERILAGALLQQGHNVSWNAELLSFTQSETGVTAEVKQDGKTGKVTASWIIGCDGENSRVREIMAVPLQGNKKTEKFVVADLALDWGMAKNEGYAFLHPSDIFTVFPLQVDYIVWSRPRMVSITKVISPFKTWYKNSRGYARAGIANGAYLDFCL